MSQSAKSHTISLLVNNKPGALIRVAQVFTRRSFNINSINVSPSLDKRYSHMTITSRGAIDTVRQIVLQLNTRAISLPKESSCLLKCLMNQNSS